MLALLLAPTLAASLLTTQACGTFLSPGFYKEQLREADAYAFLYDDVLITAIDDALDRDEGPPPGADLEAEEIAASVRDALPPDWLREQVEGAIDSAGPYLLGGADSFTYSVNLDERAGAAEAAAVSLLDRVDLHEALFAEEVPQAVEKRLGGGDALPLGITLTQEEAVAAVGRVVTPEHVRSQQPAAAAVLAAYLVGRSDAFDFTLDLSERTAALESELREIFDGADLEGYVRREALEPALGETVAANVVMPLGVVVTGEEIRAAIEAAATTDWLRVEALRLVDGIVPYLSAREDGFSLTVPLAERTDAAIRELSATVEEKYAQLFSAVPACTPAQIRELSQGSAVALCTPPGFTTRDILWVMGIDVERTLAGPVHAMAPDEVTYTEADLLAETLGTPAGDTILDLREAMGGGLTIDEADLREALAEQDEGLPEALDTLREGFRQGWHWTEEDLRGLLDDPAALDQARSAAGLFRLFSVLVSVAAAAMVAGGGLLGGRTWGGRLGWAGGALAFAALATLIVAWPLHGALTGGALEEARAEARASANDAEEIVLTKLLDMAAQATGDFVGGVRLRALLLLALGVAGVAGGVALARRGPEAAAMAGEGEAAIAGEEAAAADGAVAEAAGAGSDGTPSDGGATVEGGEAAEAEDSGGGEVATEEETSRESPDGDAPSAEDAPSSEDAPSEEGGVEAGEDAPPDSTGEGTERPPA